MKEDEISSEILHLYSGFEHADPDDQFRRKMHNQLVENTYKLLDKANSNAEKVNAWLPKLKRMAQIKKIQQGFFALFGIAITFFGISITPVENGFMLFGTEQIGIILAGIGILASSITAIFSWDDDLMRLLVTSRSDENLMFAEFSSIQSQLSFIKNEIIDLKKQK